MINWGVIGLGKIAHRFVESLIKTDEGCFYAGASRTKEKRDEFQQKYNPVKMYSDYDQMLDDENIDIVYIALPHNLHYLWALKAMKKGKAVLVEKPATLKTSELKELLDYSKNNNILFVEGMKSRFMNCTKKIHELIDNKVIGELVRIENSYTYNIPYRKDSYLFSKEAGGGLYDVGIYCIASINEFVNSEIVKMDIDSKVEYDVDVFENIEIEFANGVSANMESAMNKDLSRDMRIIGTKGYIELSPFYRATEIKLVIDGKQQVIDTPVINDDFYPEIAATHQAFKNGWYFHPEYPHQEILRNIQLMEDIHNKIMK